MTELEEQQARYIAVLEAESRAARAYMRATPEDDGGKAERAWVSASVDVAMAAAEFRKAVSV